MVYLICDVKRLVVLVKKYVRYIAAYGTAFIISLFGLALHLINPDKTAIIILAVLSFLPILLLIINFVLAKAFISRINHAKVADMQGYMLRHRNEAAEASDKLLKKLQLFRHSTVFYTVILWLLAACASLLGGVLYTYSSWLLYAMILYAGTIFFVVYSRIPKHEPIELNDDALILRSEEYPRIYKIASQAANTLGCQGDITIFLSLNCNARIARDGNKYYLQLGTVLLDILSEEELFCICLHEFSHCSQKNRKSDYEDQYISWLSSDKNIPWFMVFATNLFTILDMNYMFNHITYQYATSVVKETEADRDMAKHSNPIIAGSALLKIDYDNLFQWENGVKNEPSIYADESPNPHYLREHIERFKSAIKARHNDWNSMFEREILPNNSSHPTLKMRFEALGVQQIKTAEDNSSTDYRNEIQKALDFADKSLYEDKALYEQSRKECYLEPLERISKWKEQGEPILAETYADVVTDLKQLGRHEDAEALCDRAIKELDVNSSQHAYFIKGCTLIHRYDKSGADYIFHAIENNHNYLEEGLNEIGTFYCMMGMEKELLEYRQRAQQFAQRNHDEYRKTEFLSSKDTLSRDDMPTDMLKEILAYIRSVDEDIIQNIYLVRKTINENFFTSAFVIHFYGGTDAQRDEIMHKIFRYLDSYPVEWHFSLFDYFDYPNIKFNKIEGSLVYSKSNNKGEEQ